MRSLIKYRDARDVTTVEYFVHFLFDPFNDLSFFIGVKLCFFNSEKIVIEVKLTQYHFCVENVVLINIEIDRVIS